MVKKYHAIFLRIWFVLTNHMAQNHNNIPDRDHDPTLGQRATHKNEIRGQKVFKNFEKGLFY